MNPAITSLLRGRWFKLICGASFHHLPSIHKLTTIYTLAGADCIDLAADPAILEAAKAGIKEALGLDPHCRAPLLMVSFNDGEDPHFRKAQIGAECPADCLQPCLAICPPHAIQVPLLSGGSDPERIKQERDRVQIIADLCYGCGRCLPICPASLIETVGHQRAAAEQMPQLWQAGVRGIEIHTQVGRVAAFSALWNSLQNWIPLMQVVSISFGDGPGLESYLQDLIQAMTPPPQQLIWQVDGRPMSGDIGVGTTRATLRLAEKVARWDLPGIIQLAGGTNQATVPQITDQLPVGGVAYGSYARQLVAFALEGGGADSHRPRDTDQPGQLLEKAVEQARRLVNQVKSRCCSPRDRLPWPTATGSPALHPDRLDRSRVSLSG